MTSLPGSGDAGDELLRLLRALPGPRVEVGYDGPVVEVDVPQGADRMRGLAAGIADLVTLKSLRTPKTRLKVLGAEGAVGRFAPGSATLILSNPGGGKTSFLNAVAGRLPLTAGSLTWNGAPPGAKAAGAQGTGHVKRVVAVAPQRDAHEPLLTVRETLQFAADSCLATAALPPGVPTSRLVELTMEVLGLTECQHVRVGDELTRGVSGGQAKRLTIGETLLTGARVLCMDEITNGLDAVTAVSVTAWLARWAAETGGTLLAALQAPPPEVLSVFPQTLLLSDGAVLYHGPTSGLEAYLASVGFPCPPWAPLAEFAANVAVSPAVTAAQLRADGVLASTAAARAAPASGAEASQPAAGGLKLRLPPAAAPPATREGLASAWVDAAAKKAAAEASRPLTGGVALTTPAEVAQYGRPMVHSGGAHAALVGWRQVKVVGRNPAASVGRVMQFLILGAIFGSVYWDIPAAQFVSKLGLIAQLLATIAFACFAEIPAIFSSKRTAGRQLASGFYGPLSYVVSMVVVGLPLGLLSSLAFGAIMYSMGNFSHSGAQWGTFLGVVAGFDLATSTLFRLFALLAPVEELAQAAGGVSMGIFLIFNGLTVSFDLVPKYMYPVLYLSPFSWAARALMVNEMGSGGFYSEPVDPTAPPGASPTRGDTYLGVFGFDAGDGWVYGGGMGFLFGTAFIYGPLLSTWAVSRLRPPTPPGSTRISDAEFFAAAAAAAAAATPRSPSTPGSAAITPSPSIGSLHTVAATAAAAAAVPADAAAVTVVDVAASPNVVPSSSSPSLALPFVPTTLTFKEITYSVPVKAASGDGDAAADGARATTTTQKTLLRGVSGYAVPGTMVALMGASGAGKTTLLDVLAGRKTTGTVGGEIRLNGVRATPASFAAVAGFAQQTDVNADYATVAEALEFAAALRLPASATPAARAAHVADVMAQLELTPLAHRRTGALAPGERKRLTIAVELAANPSVLFLDEPTTGLDSRSAAVVMRVIRSVASRGRTIVCTIHQPSAEVAASFDALLVLAPGGRQVYLGPMGGASGAGMAAFFEGMPGGVPLGGHENPATWMLKRVAAASAAATPTVTAAADNGGDPETPSSAGSVGPAAYYAASQLAVSNAATLAALHEPSGKDAATAAAAAAASLARPGFVAQVAALMARTARYQGRFGLWNGLRLFVFLFLALFFGLLYLGVPRDSQAGVFAVLFAAASDLIFLSIVSYYVSLPSYQHFKGVFNREAGGGTYARAAYPVALAAGEVPWAFGLTLVYLAIAYPMRGFTIEPGPFFTAWLALSCGPLFFCWVAQWLFAVAPHPLLVNIAGGPLLQLCALFQGLQRSVPSLPAGWKWFNSADALAQALKVYALPQFAGDTSTISAIDPVTGAPQQLTAEQFVNDQLGTVPGGEWPSFGWLVLIMAGSLVLSVVLHVAVRGESR